MRAVIGTWLLVISLRNRQNRLESAYAPSREEKAEAGPPMFKSIRTRGAHRETKVRRWVDSRTSGENRVPGVTGRERQEAASGEQCRPQRGTGETSVERQPLLRSDQSSVVQLGAVVASEASSGPRRKQRGWGRRQRGEGPGGRQKGDPFKSRRCHSAVCVLPVLSRAGFCPRAWGPGGLGRAQGAED